MKKSKETKNKRMEQGVGNSNKHSYKNGGDLKTDQSPSLEAEKDIQSTEAKSEKQDLETKKKKESSSKEALEQMKKDYLYLRAEFDNYKKNMIKEQSQLIRYANESLILSFLDIFDNFEHALNTNLSSENIKEFKKGVTLIADEFRKFLTQFNVKEVPSLGKAFDPNIHEALGSEESDEKTPPGRVLRVYKKPYTLNDKVIRYGQVIVSKEKVKDKN